MSDLRKQIRYFYREGLHLDMENYIKMPPASSDEPKREGESNIMVEEKEKAPAKLHTEQTGPSISDSSTTDAIQSDTTTGKIVTLKQVQHNASHFTIRGDDRCKKCKEFGIEDCSTLLHNRWNKLVQCDFCKGKQYTCKPNLDLLSKHYPDNLQLKFTKYYLKHHPDKSPSKKRTKVIRKNIINSGNASNPIVTTNDAESSTFTSSRSKNIATSQNVRHPSNKAINSIQRKKSGHHPRATVGSSPSFNKKVSTNPGVVRQTPSGPSSESDVIERLTDVEGVLASLGDAATQRTAALIMIRSMKRELKRKRR